MHLHGLKLGTRGIEAGRLFTGSDEFASKNPRFKGGGLGLRWVSLGAFRGSNYEVSSLVFNILELLYVSIEFSCILPYESVTFSHLLEILTVYLDLDVEVVHTCSFGSGLKKTLRIVSMITSVVGL